MKLHHVVLALGVCGAVLTGCSSDPSPVAPDTDPVLQLFKIADTTMSGVRIEFYGDFAPEVGPCRLYVALVDSASNRRIRTGSATIAPKMDMGGTKNHGAAFEQLSAVNADGVSTGMVVFSMPGSWQMLISFDAKDGRTGEKTFVFPVLSSKRAKVVYGSDSSRYVIGMMSPRLGQIGMNASEFLLYERVDGYTYLPITSAQIVTTPTMPSMGHGSPGNVDPIHTGNGHYRGSLNFTMLGDWRIDVVATLPGEGPTDGATITTYFDITL